MKILVLCLSLLTLTETAFAKSKNKKKKSKAKAARVSKKLSREDAKELCLINKGASSPDDEILKCTEKTMKAGKFVD